MHSQYPRFCLGQLKPAGHRRFFSPLLWVLLLAALSMPWVGYAQTSPASFSFTGDVQIFTVPTGVTTLTVVANGAQGATGVGGGGKGGRVTATLTVTPGQSVNLYVGGQNGYNGGGSGALGNNGGGGATDIRIGGTALSNRIVVAAGGGGDGGNVVYAGGDGAYGASGGSQLAGGSGNGGNNGGAGAGGNGGNNGGGGGGGGGGYFGGGGGAAAGNPAFPGGSGGGGSSYPASATGIVTSVVHEQGANTGNGSITLSWVAAATTACTPPDVTITFPSNATVSPGPVITVPVGTGLTYQVLGGGSNGRYERKIIMDRVGGYEISTTMENRDGVFPIDKAGPYTITVTGANGCSRTVTGVIVGR